MGMLNYEADVHCRCGFAFLARLKIKKALKASDKFEVVCPENGSRLIVSGADFRLIRSITTERPATMASPLIDQARDRQRQKQGRI